MNSFQISQNHLNAMLVLAGKKDIRYYLNGLHIEWNSSTTRVIGCDGCKLGIFQTAGNNIGAGSITIPRDVIENLPKNAGELVFIQSEKWSDDHGSVKTWVINLGGGAVLPFAPCDAKYPDFRRVVHGLQTAGTSGVAAGFNLEYLNQFEKCGNLLAGSKLRMGNRLRLHHNGDNAALVLLNCVDGFAGVVMPLRDSIGSTGALFPAELTSELTATNNELAAA
jgi:DNA polymerase-3 subunit beta